MASFLKKFLFNPRRTVFFIFIAIVSIFVLGTLYLNLVLGNSLAKLETSLSRRCGFDLSVGGARFLPFNKIILTDIRTSPAQKEGFVSFSVSRASARFSLVRLFAAKQLSFSLLEVENPRLCFSPGSDPRGLLAFFDQAGYNDRLLPASRIFLRQGRVVMPLEDGILLNLGLDCSLSAARGKALEAKGTVTWTRENTATGKSSPADSLQCRFSAEPREGSLVFENFEISRNNLYAKLWGTLTGEELQCNGFVSTAPGLWTMNTDRGDSFLRKKLSGLYSRFHKEVPQVLAGKGSAFQIYDLESISRFSREKVELISARFSLNGTPLEAKGAYLPGDIPVFSFNCLSYPDLPAELRKTFPSKLDVSLSGTLPPGGFDGILQVDFVGKEKEHFLPRSISLKCEKVRPCYNRQDQLTFTCARAEAEYRRGRAPYSMTMEEIEAVFDLAEDGRIKFRLDSLLYGGRLESEGMTETGGAGLKGVYSLRLSDVDAGGISTIIPGFTFSSGILRGSMDMTVSPGPELSGEVEVAEGRVQDMEFLTWLAGFTRIPSLEEVDFSKLYLHFTADENEASLDTIAMDSSSLSLKGNFHLYASQLVSGKVSLGFSRELMETSPKFKSLCRLLGPDASAAVFDFKLSGLSEAMNFKWLSSDFKQNLQDLLPRSMEKSLEQKIEDVISSISSQ